VSGLMSCPERWPSGRRRAPAKGVRVKSPSRVRIPPSPPYGISILAGFDRSVVAATKRGFEPEIWKRGFDKIAEGDFERRARVARRARAEGPSQSLPLRHTLCVVYLPSLASRNTFEGSRRLRAAQRDRDRECRSIRRVSRSSAVSA
jgi:hypothetical protein